MSLPFANINLRSFDGSELHRSNVYKPDRYRLLESLFTNVSHVSTRGAGLSFPALSFSSKNAVLDFSSFNRMLEFNPNSGEIEVEAGITLGELAVFTCGKGWYLKVQPGHPFISVGGCIATDVHGKNQFKDLNFKEQILFLKVFHPDRGIVRCDRDNDSDLFNVTCGGFGLTGVIVSAGLQLAKLNSGRVLTKTIPIDSIYELPTILHEYGDQCDLLYSWHDLNTTLPWGPGFLKVGNYSEGSVDKNRQNDSFDNLTTVKKLDGNTRGRYFPKILNPLSTRIMNFAYSKSELAKKMPEPTTFTDFLFPVLNKTIYYDLFGAAGFHETQILIPFAEFGDVMKELEGGLRKFDINVTLASCKLFRGKSELLRFFGTGIVIALNFARNPRSVDFLNWWDSIVIESNSLPNITKDSRLNHKTVSACYPSFDNFKEKLAILDPKGIFKHSLAERLSI